jgi:hypothetical protein
MPRFNEEENMKITKVINLIISDITKVDLILTLELECM